MTDGSERPDSSLGNIDLDGTVERLFRDGRTNAIIAWVLVAVLPGVFIDSVLDLDYRWMLFVAVVSAVVLVPPVAYREWRVMLPWELLLLASLPILIRGLVGGTVGTFASYLSLAALALLGIVELHMFTELTVTHWFAVCLVVLTTLAAAAAWTVFRWNADRFLGTSYLTTNEALMAEWLYVTLAGLVAGVLFDGYFRRRDRRLWRVVRRMVRR
ncbi:hypothetical protein SAMN05443574_10590 [Haloarcula vallismortis]|uniref:Uncharacterized protein n=2 Tax=Haloarcula vallismortis TaxID=28442 RepID=M0JF81_HALVA|nr:hypothetical protein [Haloarcula vallismortis]EMA06664.1 hypothetical protein C437_11188 [Haloarcula vallismortis ATCC 29715]SDW62520.1 hypothetical protein SAMN05443574_10590 [Haloarcula vallismortis]